MLYIIDTLSGQAIAMWVVPAFIVDKEFLLYLLQTKNHQTSMGYGLNFFQVKENTLNQINLHFLLSTIYHSNH